MNRCRTKYPILFLHGLGFHDRTPVHYYWGRIPRVLRKHGAKIYFGNQDGNATVAVNARRLVPVVRRILQETGAEKINIIAHSKGGLEARYLVSTLGMGEVIASVTTLSTPHNGSPTVDWLMRYCRVPLRAGCAVFDLYRKFLGDKNPRTYAVLIHLTTERMQQFNLRNPDDDRVFYQSYAFIMRNSGSDAVMSIPHMIVEHFEGPNDGLLSPRDTRWTNFRGVYTSASGRGISHPDETDYRQVRFTNKTPAHHREIANMVDFYVNLVEELQWMGF